MELLFTLGCSYRNWYTWMHRSLNSGHVQYFKFATLCFLWITWRKGGNAFPVWHHSINFSHVARDHGSTTAFQPSKALISGSKKMCRRFFCTFPGLLLPLSYSLFAILALRSSYSRSIAKNCEPTSSNHVVKWSQLLSSPMTYLASSCFRSCRPRCSGFGHCAWQWGADL
jgi:hypothetical protein